jgi:hypothetical protein
MVLLFGYDFVIAAGNGRILNLASNIAALLVFMRGGQGDFPHRADHGCWRCSWAPRWARVLAIKTGVRYVRPAVFAGVHRP